MVVAISTVNRDLSLGALNGSQLFAHIMELTKLLITPNTFGWVRSGNLSISRTCHVMLDFVQHGHTFNSTRLWYG